MERGTRTADVSRQYGTFPQRSILSKLNASLWKCSYFKKTAFFEIAGSLWQFLSYDNSLPSLRLTLKSRAICRLTRPPLVVMYACTIPPTLHAQAPTSGPIPGPSPGTESGSVAWDIESDQGVRRRRCGSSVTTSNAELVR